MNVSQGYQAHSFHKTNLQTACRPFFSLMHTQSLSRDIFRGKRRGSEQYGVSLETFQPVFGYDTSCSHARLRAFLPFVRPLIRGPPLF